MSFLTEMENYLTEFLGRKYVLIKDEEYKNITTGDSTTIKRAIKDWLEGHRDDETIDESKLKVFKTKMNDRDLKELWSNQSPEELIKNLVPDILEPVEFRIYPKTTYDVDIEPKY